jgi:hypothetical protein
MTGAKKKKRPIEISTNLTKRTRVRQARYTWAKAMPQMAGINTLTKIQSCLDQEANRKL